MGSGSPLRLGQGPGRPVPVPLSCYAFQAARAARVGHFRHLTHPDSRAAQSPWCRQAAARTVRKQTRDEKACSHGEEREVFLRGTASKTWGIGCHPARPDRRRRGKRTLSCSAQRPPAGPRRGPCCLPNSARTPGAHRHYSNAANPPRHQAARRTRVRQEPEVQNHCPRRNDHHSESRSRPPQEDH